MTGSTALLPAPAIQALQFVLLGLGIAGSLVTAHQLARRAAGRSSTIRVLAPQLAVLLVFSLVNVYLFTLPMAHRV